jgi:hypothetical protein
MILYKNKTKQNNKTKQKKGQCQATISFLPHLANPGTWGLLPPSPE